MNYKVTIITVCYNCVNDILNTIESIIPLTGNHVEYLIIDGGSTDGTVEILKSYEGSPHFHYISEKDSGIYNAMNKAKNLVNGEWFCFINCGDRLLKVPDLEKYHDVDAVCCAVQTENGIEYPSYNFKLKIRNTLPHQGLFYHKKNFLGFDEKYKVFADYALNLDMYHSHKKIGLSKQIVSFHSLDGVSNNISAKKELNQLLYSKNSFPVFLLALLYAKYSGIRQRIKNLLKWKI